MTKVDALVPQWRSNVETHEIAARSHLVMRSPSEIIRQHQLVARAYRECADALEAARVADRADALVPASEHLAFVAVMNALDVHMPPDGRKLLKELREIAATVGYPWKGVPSSEQDKEKQ